MIQVEVLFFANLAEEVGRRAEQVALDDPSLTGLWRALSTVLDDSAISALQAENVRLARNQTLWDGQGPIEAGDELAFLPPVTGG